eukprot:gnl/MRDRNA2_/MRDRNA2_105822_c0_seq1.p1 gnl/MRDRNA2_/MRDRNA2_105822_c0~~gnl/MRDRNA2_/MRDRNA2_105822_c0_seq1.p1  ORF type:complete len:275 (-),score=40.50 gnl/MRDRNA2_/MRDRNA2_105822_c0_seq1:322-1146(-)
MTAPTMEAFTCQICFEDKLKRLELPQLKTGNGDVLRARDCAHPFCQECMAAYVSARVEQQFVFHLRCPQNDCSTELYEQDLRRLVRAGALPVEVANRFAELRARDYSVRAEVLRESAKKLMESTSACIENLDTLRQLSRIRLCPRCSVAMQKSHGCDSFYCICGHKFNYRRASNVLGPGSSKLLEFCDKVSSLAKNYQMPLRMAELLHQSHCGHKEAKAKVEEARQRRKTNTNAVKLTRQTGLPLEDAKELQRLAFAGDPSARLRIQQARAVRA